MIIFKHIGLASGIGLLVGIVGMQFWYAQQYPSRPLFVEIENLRGETIPLLKIEHGNDLSQEKILLTQLQAGETRIVTLNHEPGRGYSVEVQLADGKTVEACVGKTAERWVNKVAITSNGIFSRD